ncbi:MAG: hypothetical protein J2O46_03375 [Nocardioides sp.]|nr:hypothetical protein [Nocardioides sp.]
MNVRHALAAVATATLLLGGAAACGSDSAEDPGSGSSTPMKSHDTKMNDDKSPMMHDSQSPMMHDSSPADDMSN